MARFIPPNYPKTQCRLISCTAVQETGCTVQNFICTAAEQFKITLELWHCSKPLRHSKGAICCVLVTLTKCHCYITNNTSFPTFNKSLFVHSPTTNVVKMVSPFTIHAFILYKRNFCKHFRKVKSTIRGAHTGMEIIFWNFVSSLSQLLVGRRRRLYRIEENCRWICHGT